ncbi:MAG: hypothetical protein RRY54_00795 [Angelakisella sp.]
MTSTTLSSKGRFKNLLFGMFRKNIPTAIYLFVVLFIAFPLQTFMNTARVKNMMVENVINSYGSNELMMGLYTDGSLVFVVTLMLLATFAIGLVQSSYLHSKRAVDLYHSLPITRTELMSANVITAFTSVMLPFLLNYIINLGVVLYRNSILGVLAQPLLPYEVFWDIAGWCVTVFTILSVVMLVSTQVGSVFENMVFSAELLAVPLVVIMINELLCEQFLLGYMSRLNYKYVAASSPASLMVGFYAERTDNEAAHFFSFVILAWLIFGALIYAAALVLYRRRRSELAESTGCKGILGNLLTVFAVYIGGIGVGSLLYITLNLSGEGTYIAWVMVGAVLVFVLVEMILNRGFAGMKKSLPLGAVSCVCVFAAVFAITSGGLGYENRVPAADKVTSVSFDYRGWYDYVTELDAASKRTYTAYPEDKNDVTYSYEKVQTSELKTPEAIELVRQIHLSTIADMRTASTENSSYYRRNGNVIQYNMGKHKLTRRYDGYSDETLALMLQLCELPELQENTNPILRLRSETVEGIGLYDSFGFKKYEMDISRDMGTLLEAMKLDARANGTRDFTANSPVLCYLYIDTGGERGNNRNLEENLILNFSVPVFASSTNTISALNAMGKGDILLPSDISEITEIGFGEYADFYSDNMRVTVVNNYYEKDPQSYDYMIQGAGEAKEILDNAVRFSAGRENYGDANEYTYFTLFKGEEMGITVMVAPENLPESIKDMFPELMERARMAKIVRAEKTFIR